MSDVFVGTYRNPAYEDDRDTLISKASWPLRVSGIVFAGLLLIGRSASYGNVTWTPAFHANATPLVVIAGGQKAPPIPPKPVQNDPAAISKRSAADEVVAFSPGNDDDEGDGHSGSGGDEHGGSGGGEHGGSGGAHGATGGGHTNTGAAHHEAGAGDHNCDSKGDTQSHMHTGASGNGAGGNPPSRSTVCAFSTVRSHS